MQKLGLIALGASVFGFALACSVSFDDSKMRFRCKTDADCAGDEFTCINEQYCCKPNGAEVEHGCDHIDNDCNGQIDEGAGTVEACNLIDDNCDGQTDEGFDLTSDPRNCGGCMVACLTGQACVSSSCVTRAETSCSDGIDNDGNGQTDCVDPTCNLQSCGMGCQCRALVKAEGNCNDDIDNDGDNAKDCEDPDCDGAGCGPGCTCAGMARKEVDCRNMMDDDNDGLPDCQDPDCQGLLCQADPSTFRCGGPVDAGSCLCNDGGIVAETGVRCRDGRDNDCDGLIDCKEMGCDGVSCSPDGGPGCLCANLVAKETNCADRKDNDNDGTTDCGDSLADGGGDCPINTACTFLRNGMVKPGMCAADHTCR